ncbi:hypothetical protein [Thiosulfativibrio zosterae]|uniref:GTPase n=1 Tax=Thiosulfativibrio zosterae TaxID=2675053 RepID=A0A6F8PLD4_9GAMM|nr:hypothetical protein [Thiosulfativibrio zosterae]BBP42923.1 hypothetical protein THMIRHAT_06690 [Thiosulfativibrio zosterae]
MAHKPSFNHLSLVGLPGSGKSRLAAHLLHVCQEQNIPLSIVESILPDLLDKNARVVCLVDVRSPWPDTLNATELPDYFLKLLAVADAVMLMFLASSDLDLQMHWQAQIQTRLNQIGAAKLPILRSFEGELSASQLEKLWQLPQNTPALKSDHLNPLQMPPWQTLVFKVGQVNLTHLQMGLEGLRHSGLGLIWRIVGSFETPEYSHPVSLEFTPFRLDFYPAEQCTHQLTCWVSSQNVLVLEPLLQDLFKACSVECRHST